jgi:hypothetical protein
MRKGAVPAAPLARLAELALGKPAGLVPPDRAVGRRTWEAFRAAQG